MNRSRCPICGKGEQEFKHWIPEGALYGYFYANCWNCGSTIRYNEEILIMAHNWKRNYIGKYKEVFLIDRYKLMKKIMQDYENDKKNFNPFQSILDVEGIDPVDIIEEFEEECKREAKWNP